MDEVIITPVGPELPQGKLNNLVEESPVVNIEEGIGGAYLAYIPIGIGLTIFLFALSKKKKRRKG